MSDLCDFGLEIPPMQVATFKPLNGNIDHVSFLLHEQSESL